MDVAKLLKMANQVGTFFEAYPDQAAAADETAAHLRRFWTPAMRSQLLECLEVTRGEGASPLVLEAARRLREGTSKA
jgi:formate dehydrogenase subunit delta